MGKMNDKSLPKGISYDDSHPGKPYLVRKTITDRYKKKHTKRIRCKTLGEANRALRELDRTFTRELYEPTPDVTLNVFFYGYFTEKMETQINLDGKKKRTWKNYQYNYVHYIADTLGHLKIAEIKASDIDNLLESYSHLSKATNSTIKATLSTIFTYAQRCDIIMVNLVMGAKLYGKETKKKLALTVNLQKEFVRYARNRCSVFETDYHFLLQTGLRISELRGLRWSDVDFERRVIHIRNNRQYIGHEGWDEDSPKTGNGKRDVNLSETAIRILRERRDLNDCRGYSDSEYIFINTKGHPSHISNYNRDIRNILADMYRDGVINEEQFNKRFSEHQLRGTNLTRLYEAGVDDVFLEGHAGHADIRTTKNYYIQPVDEKWWDKGLKYLDKIG